MTSRPATIGLFADGPVGAATLGILADRCPQQIAYVAVPSLRGAVADVHGQIGLVAPLLNWSGDTSSELPRFGGAAPDVVFLAWWPFIVRRPFLEAGQRATLNMHPSLLPHGRGKDPNFWSLALDEPFGVTIHHVDEGVDTGDIAFQSALNYGWEDTGATLHARAQAELVRLFETSLEAILQLDIPAKSQGPGPLARRRAEIDPQSLLDLDATSTWRDALNLLRARTFSPHPGCRFKDATGAYEVRVEIKRIED